MSGADLAPFVLYVAFSGRAAPACAELVAQYGDNPDVYLQDIKLLHRTRIPSWLSGVPCLVIRETREVVVGKDECQSVLGAALAQIPRSATGMGGGFAAGGVPQTMAAFENGAAMPVGVAVAFNDGSFQNGGGGGPTAEPAPGAGLPDALQPVTDGKSEKLPESTVLAYMARRQENMAR